ncbi:MAG: hypothetical protein KDD82_06420, partial [Planctomycetes bacterium]|nr:hypothetical protein [Planctomycetota bacterium]
RYGQAIQRAGLRKGDVVLGLAVGDEAAPIVSNDHLHSWWRLTRAPGERVRLAVARGEARLSLEVEVLPPHAAVR